MATTYRVLSGTYSGTGLASTTPVVLATSGMLATLPAGWASASAVGSVFTFFDANAKSLGAVTLTLSSLVKTIVGSAVLIQSGLGQGWTLGQVISDGVTLLIPGYATPLALTARAAVGLAGFQTLTNATAAYALQGASSDATTNWFIGNGQTFTAGAMATLAGVSAGQQCVYEQTANAFFVATI